MSAPRIIGRAKQLEDLLKEAPCEAIAADLVMERTQLQLKHPMNDKISMKNVPILEKYGHLFEGSILDVGCMGGFLYEYLGKPYDYHGVDIWRQAILGAKAAYPEASFRVKDGFDVTDKFDTIWCSQIIDNRVPLLFEHLKTITKKHLIFCARKDYQVDPFEMIGPLKVVVHAV